MRKVPKSELGSDFEREFGWGDDERYLYNSNQRKASVFGYFLRLQEVIRLVHLYSPGKRLVDIACAQGNFGLLLAEQDFDTTAVDIHPDFLNYAKRKHTHGKFTTVQANLMEYRDESGFDCAVVGEVIEHVAFPKDLLKSVWDNLKPGGICVLTTPNGEDYSSTLPTYLQVTNIEELIPRQFHWGDHLFLYTASELKDLVEGAGFEVLYLEKYHSAYVSQLKAVRYLLPLRGLCWLERKTRHWKKAGKDSSNQLIIVGRKR